MFDVFDNRDKCGKPEFMRGNTYTSCISVVLLNHFANKSNTFLLSFPLCLPLSLSHFLPFPPWVSTSSYPGYHDTAIKGTLLLSGANKYICHSSLRRPFYFRNDPWCIICINHPLYHDRETEKNLQDILLVRPRTCSKDVLGHSWLNGGYSDYK